MTFADSKEDVMTERRTTAGVKELGHIVLYARSLERSVRFYRDAPRPQTRRQVQRS